VEKSAKSRLSTDLARYSTLKSWAVFLDRDGVLNELVFYKDQGRVGSPLSAKQLRVTPSAGRAVRELSELGAKVIVISNQPGIAKKQLSYMELEKMNQKIKRELSRNGGHLDGEYYCLHHPNSLLKKYKAVCDCRKPKPGLLLKAAADLNIDLNRSFMVGDSLVDIKAGKAAGVRTILVGTITDLLNRVIEEDKAPPDFIVGKFTDVPVLLKKIAM
jgi:histidinol-phosphate phosphatase family protein